MNLKLTTISEEQAQKLEISSNDIHTGTVLFHKRTKEFGCVINKQGRYVDVQLFDGNRVIFEDCLTEFLLTDLL